MAVGANENERPHKSAAQSSGIQLKVHRQRPLFQSNTGAIWPCIMCSHQKNGATVLPTPLFNPKDDAEKLKTAMKGRGCKTTDVVNILCRRTAVERGAIAREFKSAYGKDLVKELVSELSGDLEDLMVSLVDPVDVFDAKQLKKAIKGLGTDEDTLIEILCSRTNQEINAIKAAYKQLYGKELEADIASDTGSQLKSILVSLLQANRDTCSGSLDMGRVDADANKLFNDGKKFDVNDLNDILVTRSDCHIKAVFVAYLIRTQQDKKAFGDKAGVKNDLEKAMKKQLSGDTEKAYLAIVAVTNNKPAYFAQLLFDSMKGMGTRDDDLCRVIISRSEKDLVDIKNEYQRLFGKTLAKDISGDTGGKYKEALLALIGEK